VRPGLQRDGFSYLLAMRLIPVVPFWLTNLARRWSACRSSPMPARPSSASYRPPSCSPASAAGAGNVLAAYGRPDLSLIWSPLVLLPLAGLAALSLLPVLWRRWRAWHG